VKKPSRPIGKAIPKLKTDQPTSTPAASPARMRDRLRLAAKVIPGFLVTLIGLIASIYGIWGAPWPTKPRFSPGLPSFGSSFDIPFIVTNKSAFFALSNLTVTCVLLRFRAEGANGAQVRVADGLTFDTAPKILASGANRIESTESRPYTCPLRGLMRVDNADAADAISEAQIGFISEYDSPLWWGQQQAKDGPFTLITTTVPRQWERGAPLK
jgi:hypothetical protein